MKTLDWYFDVLSPFAYLQLEHFHRLPDHVMVRYRPVLLGALLENAGQKGPAEIPGKRVFTYRHVLWLARQHGIALKMPPAHPFNPLKLLRLIVALGSTPEAVRAVFRFVWQDGATSEDPAAWAGLIDRLDAREAAGRLDDPAVKDQLRANTRQAIEAGVFGVPTFRVDGENFWGFDATGMLLDYLADPKLFQDPEMERISHLPVGIQRRPKGEPS